MALAVPGLAENWSSPQPMETWVNPVQKQLYCEPQREGYCGVHALNAMAGKQVLTPAQAIIMSALLQRIPRSADDGQDFAPGGWFRIEAICKLMYYFTGTECHVHCTTIVPRCNVHDMLNGRSCRTMLLQDAQHCSSISPMAQVTLFAGAKAPAMVNGTSWIQFHMDMDSIGDRSRSS
jgi:hypothetical protein